MPTAARPSDGELILFCCDQVAPRVYVFNFHTRGHLTKVSGTKAVQVEKYFICLQPVEHQLFAAETLDNLRCFRWFQAEFWSCANQACAANVKD
jgi:hypothetical protein